MANLPQAGPPAVIGGGAGIGGGGIGGGGGGGFSLFGTGNIIPDASVLLSLKLLGEQDPIYNHIAKEQTKWLSMAVIILRKDPFLKMKLGGSILEASSKLAVILRQRAEERNIQRRLDVEVDTIVNAELDGSGFGAAWGIPDNIGGGALALQNLFTHARDTNGAIEINRTNGAGNRLGLDAPTRVIAVAPGGLGQDPRVWA